MPDRSDDGGESADGRAEPIAASDAVEIKRLLQQLDLCRADLVARDEDLRQANEALEAFRDRYQDLFAAPPVGYLTVGLQGKILTCNPRAGELLRLPPVAVATRRITEFMPPDSVKLYQDHRERLFKTGEPIVFETEMRRSSAAPFWAELRMSVSREDENGSLLCQLTLTEVTERRRMQDDVARLAAIVTSADQAILSEDLEGTIMSWNAGAERLFGYTAVQAIGHNSGMLLPVDRASEGADVRARIRHGDPVSCESIRVRRDGSRVPIFMAAAPIHGPTRRIAGASHIVRDISEQVVAREEIARLLGDLRQADRRKDDFIATLAHELRNPLAPIRNAAAVLRFAPDLDPKVGWCRDVIDRQVGHMASLLEDLLDVSRLTRNKLTLRRDRIELGVAIARAVEVSRPIINGHGHWLDLELPSTPIEVIGDLTRLTQVFGNLLNNAAKYTKPDGKISLTVELRAETVLVRVRDNGIGIAADDLDSIFQMFAQISGPPGVTEGGLGIGLALVKALVERHGGSVRVQSEGLDRGSEFEVMLPLAGRAPDVGAATVSKSTAVGVEGNGSSHRILVVDDNKDAGESMAMMLEIHGYDVRVAWDGEHALEVAASYHPDVLLLDLGMPRVDGYEVARRIRQEPWGRNIILVACTGWGQPGDRLRSQQAGFDHHLVKPVSPDEVLRLLEGLGNASVP